MNDLKLIRHFLKSGLTIIIFFCSGIACLQAQVVNPGFETGTFSQSGGTYYFDGWLVGFNSSGGTATPSFDSTYKNSGVRSIKIDRTWLGDPVQVWNIRMDMVPEATHGFTQGDKVTFSFYARASVNGYSMNTKFRDADNGNSVTNTHILTTEFKRYEVLHTIPATRDDYKLTFHLAHETGPVWIDDVSVSVAADPDSANKQSAVYYVSVNSGSDTNAGSKDSPFKTIGKAVSLMDGADSCYVIQGDYYEEISMEGVHGTAVYPIVITSVPGDTVTLRGTESLDDLKADGATWSLHSGNIYEIALKKDIWQLILNGEEMVPARWPNGFFNTRYGTTVYSHKSFMECTTFSENGEPVVGGDGDVVLNPGDLLKDVNGNVVLRSHSNFPADVVGAIAIMNTGSWNSWARDVTEQVSANEFVYQPQIKENQLNAREQVYFLEGKLAFLDAPTEWFYDRESRMLYLWSETGLPPMGDIQGKTQSFAIRLNGCNHVHIIGLNFFGTTFTGDNCRYLLVEDCNLEFPHTSRRMLGEAQTVNVTSINSGIDQWMPSHSGIRNCTMKDTDGPAVILAGYGNNIVNCLFERIDWTGAHGGGFTIYTNNSPGLLFSRNTIRITGACEGLGCPKSVKTLNRNGDYQNTSPWLTAPYVTYEDLFPTLVEFNHLSEMGTVQSDGAHVQAGSTQVPALMYRFNWAYVSDKNGLRFDGGGGWDNAPPPVDGTQHHNVVFGTRKMSVKGDRQYCFNNTCFDASQQDIYIGGNYPRFNAFNSRSKTGNNACNTISYSFDGPNGVFPGEDITNFVGGLEGTDVKSLLVDVDQFDFRPHGLGTGPADYKNPLVDAGTVEHGYTFEHFEQFLAAEVVVPDSGQEGMVPGMNALAYMDGITSGYTGEAPDIGAYEYGSDTYWIPGRKEKKASYPIPNDGISGIPLDRDLIFLNGYKAGFADIYLGTDSLSVARAAPDSSEFLVRVPDPKNVIDPRDYGRWLGPVTRYFWRVDAVKEDGKETGDIWSFTSGGQTWGVQFRVYGKKDGIITPLTGADLRISETYFQTGTGGGSQVVQILPGETSYRIGKKGFTSKGSGITIQSDTLIPDTLMAEKYNLHLKIVDEGSGDSVPGTELEIEGLLHPVSPGGEAELTDLDYGFYQIRINAPGYKEYVDSLEIYSDTSIVITIRFEYFSGEITVVDRSSGEGVYRAVMKYNEQTKLSNAEGLIRITDLSRGKLVFSIEEDSYFSISDSLMISSDTSITVSMTSRLADVEIMVSDDVGAVANARVSLESFMILSGSDGKAWFPNRPARQQYTYRVEKDGYQSVYDSLYLELDTLLKVKVLIASGLNDFGVMWIKLYPNPVRDRIHLETVLAGTDYYLYNQLGVLIRDEKELPEVYTVDVTGLSPGIYVLAVKSDAGIARYRISKQ